MTPEQEQMIERLTELEKQATPGPWEPDFHRGDGLGEIITSPNSQYLVADCFDPGKNNDTVKADADLIIELRNNLPAILTLVREQARALERVKAERWTHESSHERGDRPFCHVCRYAMFMHPRKECPAYEGRGMAAIHVVHRVEKSIITRRQAIRLVREIRDLEASLAASKEFLRQHTNADAAPESAYRGFRQIHGMTELRRDLEKLYGWDIDHD